jgi:hypothetical protein
MHAAGKFLRQRRVDHAVPLQPALSAKRVRHNIKTKVGLPAGPVAGVALVLVRLVFDTQTVGGKGLLQFFRDYILGAHDVHAWSTIRKSASRSSAEIMLH